LKSCYSSDLAIIVRIPSVAISNCWSLLSNILPSNVVNNYDLSSGLRPVKVTTHSSEYFEKVERRSLARSNVSSLLSSFLEYPLIQRVLYNKQR
jgi:hypothetical protein